MHSVGMSLSMSAIACERIGVRTDATAGQAASGKRGRERDCTSCRDGWVSERVSRKSMLLAIGSKLGVLVGWRPRAVVNIYMYFTCIYKFLKTFKHLYCNGQNLYCNELIHIHLNRIQL